MATVNPNHPAARAAPAAGEPPIPLVTYQQILQDMRVDRTNHEVGTALAQGAMDEPWSTVWKSFPTAALTALTADQYRGHVATTNSTTYWDHPSQNPINTSTLHVSSPTVAPHIPRHTRPGTSLVCPGCSTQSHGGRFAMEVLHQPLKGWSRRVLNRDSRTTLAPI